MNARLRRITSDYEQIKKDFLGHKNVIVEPIGPEPPEKYRVTYFINGIYLQDDGRIETLGKHVAIITLPSEYPRYKPICTITTPIWHPNFRDGQICIGDIWGAGETLSDIIVNIGDMIQYKSWNSYSPLSADAAEWAISNKHLFPVGEVSLWTSDETNKDNISLAIEIEDEADDVPDKVAEATPETEQIPASDLVSLVESEIASEPKIEAATDADLAQKSDFGMEDFEITALELQGIEFIPSAARMQDSQHVSRGKGGRINFKTIMAKGVMYGFLGGLVGWLLQEFVFVIEADDILKWMGYSIHDTRWMYSMSEYEFADLMRKAVRLSSGITFAAVGAAIGGILGLGESIYYGSKSNLAKFGLIGLGVGIALGFFGGYIGQTIYSVLLENTTDTTSETYMALVRALGWAILGAGCGLAAGLIKPEKIRVINCLVGGLIGGFIGGFAFNFIATAVTLSDEDTGILPRMVGIIIMGTLVGLGIGLLEQFAKAAWLKVIRGEFEGKEYLVFEGTTSIGNSGKNTIALFKDKLVAPHHCDILQEGGKYVLVDQGSSMGTVVNGMKISGRYILHQGDAIAIGNSVLVFNVK